MSRRFMYQGKEYSSLEELPPEARQVYEQVFKSLADNNHNGIPDLLEGMTANTLVSALNAIHLNGQNYNSVEEMPPEARRIYDKAMAAVAKWTDQDQDGIPDLLQGMAAAEWMGPDTPKLQSLITSQTQTPSQPQPQPEAPSAPYPPSAPVTPAISGDVESGERNLRLLIVGGLVLVLLVVIAGLAALLLFGGILPH